MIPVVIKLSLQNVLPVKNTGNHPVNPAHVVDEFSVTLRLNKNDHEIVALIVLVLLIIGGVISV